MAAFVIRLWKLELSWLCCIAADLRIAAVELFRFLRPAWKLPFRLVGQIMKADIRRRAVRSVGFVAIIYAAAGALLFSKDIWAGSVFLTMLRWLLPLATVCAVLAECLHVSASAFRLIFIMTCCGLVTQVGLSTDTAAELLHHHVIAVGAALMGSVAFFYLSRLDARCMLHLVNAASAFVYVLLLLMPTSHGTRAWLYLGGVSLQGTELTRAFAVLAVARATTMPENSDKDRALLAYKTLLLHGAALVLVNELSTGLLILLTSGIVMFLAIRQLRWLFAGAAGGGIVAYLSFLLCELSAQLGGRGPFRLGSLIYNKLIERVLDPSQLDAYQTSAAYKARLLSGWFGNKSRVYIPEADSDFAIVSTIQQFGYISFFLVLLVMCALAVWALLNVSTHKASFPSVLALGCVVTLEVQFFLNAVSALSLGPVMGLPAPFLSMGGTNLAVSFFFCGMVLAASTDIPVEEPEIIAYAR